MRAVGSFNERIWKGLIWVVPFIIGLLLYETITRYVFHNPCIWSTELLGHLIVACMVLGGGYVLLKEEHVRMDALYDRWSPRTKAIIDIATFCLFVYLFAVVFTFIPSAVMAFRINQRSATFWGPPWWPIKTAIAVGAIILILQGIAILIRDIATLRGRPLP